MVKEKAATQRGLHRRWIHARNHGMDELLIGVREGKNLRFVESVKNGLTS
jgi:hypothetical protein